MKRKSIMIRISDSLYLELLSLAKQEDRILSNYIVHILKKHLENIKEKEKTGEKDETN